MLLRLEGPKLRLRVYRYQKKKTTHLKMYSAFEDECSGHYKNRNSHFIFLQTEGPNSPRQRKKEVTMMTPIIDTEKVSPFNQVVNLALQTKLEVVPLISSSPSTVIQKVTKSVVKYIHSWYRSQLAPPGQFLYFMNMRTRILGFRGLHATPYFIFSSLLWINA